MIIPLLILTPLILLSAIGAVWKARPVHAALLLALSLALVAVLYLTIGADFIGLVQFMVYVGAVAILIVFSLLITRPGDEAEEIERRPRSMVTGLICTLPVLAVLLIALVKGNPADSAAMVMPTGSNEAVQRQLRSIELEMKGYTTDSSGNPTISIAHLGKLLFTTHAPAVLAVGVLLTAVMIGAALFARDTEKPKSNPSEK